MDSPSIEEKIVQTYVRVTLGQSFPNPEKDNDGRLIHKRFNFDAKMEFFSINRDICELFSNNLHYNIVFHSHKGIAYLYKIKKEDYNTYNYWSKSAGNIFNGRMDRPYITVEEVTGKSTVKILTEAVMNSIGL